MSIQRSNTWLSGSNHLSVSSNSSSDDELENIFKNSRYNNRSRLNNYSNERLKATWSIKSSASSSSKGSYSSSLNNQPVYDDDNDGNAVKCKNHNSLDLNEYEKQNDDFKKYSYCYLCSIQSCVHKRTEPVPIHKRRYLKPYINPVALLKKYEENLLDVELRSKYKFSIKTGPGQYAGTDSNIYFKLFGTAGFWKETELKCDKSNREMKFPSNSIVDIELEGPIIGDLRKLKIWHNGKSIKEGWYLDYVEITCYRLKQTWKFICDRWLSIHRPPDRKNSVELISYETLRKEKIGNSVEYFILIKTADKPLAVNDVNVTFYLVGTKGESNQLDLLTPYVTLFQPNQLDAFLIMSPVDLGKPEKLRVILESNGKQIRLEWVIQEILVIYSKDPNKFYKFRFEKWKEKSPKIFSTFNPESVIPIDSSKEPSNTGGVMIYHITVITGNKRLAGTDARVFIEMKGTNGKSKVHRLHNPNTKKEFERNQTDHFNIFDANIGELKRIRIFHDNSGSAPGWYLETVLIRCTPTTITGKQDKHETELNDQLEKLRRKFILRELKLEKSIETTAKGSKPHRRSSSVELTKSTSSSKSASNNLEPNLQKPRSLSAESHLANKKNEKLIEFDDSNTVDLKKVLKKNLEKNKMSSSTESQKNLSSNPDLTTRTSPTSSILKTSGSPRVSSKKQVKFHSNESSADPTSSNNKSNQQQQSSPKYKLKINWVMSIVYDNQNTITKLKSIENVDKSLKNIDDKLLNKYEILLNNPSKIKEQAEQEKQTETSTGDKNIQKEIDKFIYVFECKKWLAKDSEDRKIDRVIKTTAILNAK